MKKIIPLLIILLFTFFTFTYLAKSKKADSKIFKNDFQSEENKTANLIDTSKTDIVQDKSNENTSNNSVKTTKDSSTATEFKILDSKLQYVAEKQFLNSKAELVIGTSENPENFNISLSNGLYSGNLELALSDFTTSNTRRDSSIKKLIDENISVNFQDLDVDLSKDINNLEVNITINGVTKKSLTAFQIIEKDDLYTLEANTEIIMSDFGITPPNVANLYKVNDNVNIAVSNAGDPILWPPAG